jgi:uroporphyrin-III C-methyltransferase/precorrin-2 dehydrogenase/sirohydrochlorin ferrochelatase
VAATKAHPGVAGNTLPQERLFPMFLKLKGQRCLVVGAGPIAEGKIDSLLGTGAEIIVVAPQATARVVGLAGEEAIVWHRRPFDPSDLDGALLVITAATGDVNAEVYAEAQRRGILCNSVDDPEHCHFYYSSVVNRGPLQIAVSTAGESPALAQRLRMELEARYGEEYASWVQHLGDRRRQLFEDHSLSPERRRELLHQLASEDGFKEFVSGNTADRRENRAVGKVYLVGAGPGDPELLTLKALRLLKAADVILHDDLVGPEILSLLPPDAEVENVGKRAGGKHVPQADINASLIAHARTGKRVVRLKGGDPLLFGRAGEEMDALQAAGVRFEVVPGVTSALSAAASGRFSLTDRRLSSAVLIVSGHACDGNSVTDWAAAVATGATIVVYMPGEQQSLAGLLIEAGMDPQTPCAVISQASLPEEQSEYGTVEWLAGIPAAPKPRLLVIGPAVSKAARGWPGAVEQQDVNTTLQLAGKV